MVVSDHVNNNMIESQRQTCEYHIAILSVKMKVKFPCRMKIQHLGSLLTGESPLTDDNRYIFNQTVVLKDQNHSDCLQLTVNLVTDKGAKYIAGIIKLYPTELVRSQGERLVLSLTKCIDSEAFCEVKVDQVVSQKAAKAVAYDRKGIQQRDVPFRQRQTADLQFSPHRSAYNVKIQQSKSEYQFPLHQNGRGARNDWDTRSRMVPPQTVYQKSKARGNLANEVPVVGFEDTGSVNREKAMEAEVYKEGYQKLKEKYKKETELNKQQLNKRLALQNSENNLKLQIMRLKLKSDEQEKVIGERGVKLKQLQTLVATLQQKQAEGAYLRQENGKKDGNIKMLQEKVRTLSRNLQEVRDMAADRNTEEGNRIKELHAEMQSMKGRFQLRERELEKESKGRLQLLHEKELQLVSKTDSLERERKAAADLEKALQSKHFQTDKLLQNEKNTFKSKMDDHRSRYQKLQRDLSKCQQSKKQSAKQLQQLRAGIIKVQYDKKLLTQQLQSIKAEHLQAKGFKQKYMQLSRQHRSALQQRTQVQRQLQRAIQSKQSNISEISKQCQDQLQYYKRVNRQLDEKSKGVSNRLLEVQGQLQLSRSQQDKLRRGLQASVKEAAEAREKEKSSRKALKVKEQEALSVETEMATLKQKLKSIDQIYKLEVDKLREESDRVRMQYENEVDKNGQLQEAGNQSSMELNKLRIKLQYAQQRAEKEGLNLREKQAQVQTLIRDYQQQVGGLDQSLNALRLVEKELATRLQKSELEGIRSEERVEKLRKEVRVLEERCGNSENALKGRTAEVLGLQGAREALERRVGELEGEGGQLKSQGVALTNQRNKLSKMNQLLGEQLKKAKADIAQLTSALSQREKQQQQLREALKNEKQQYSKLDGRFSTYRKQVQRSKQTLFQIIQKSLFTLPLGTKQDGKRSMQLLLTKKPIQNSFAQYFAMIASHSKDIKQSLTRQSDSIRQLQREKQRMQEEVSVSSSKYQSAEVTLKSQIEEMEVELQRIVEDRQVESRQYGERVEELEDRVRELEGVEEELNNQIQELNFTNNSMRLDYEAIADQSGKKIANLKKVNGQLQQKIQYQTMTIADLDERCSGLQGEIDALQSNLQGASEAGVRRERAMAELRAAGEASGRLVEELKRARKELQERVSELELHLNTEREMGDKNKQLLAEEEAKGNELKVFISSLMKQKEAAIKSELERGETILTLESSLHEMGKELELVREQNVKNVKNLELLREGNRKMTASLKQADNEKKEERGKQLKVQEKLREKEKELMAKDEALKKLQLKSQKAIQKLKGELKELQEEIDIRSNSNLQQTKDTNQRIIQLESQIQKKNVTIASLQIKLNEIEEQLFAQRQKVILAEQSVSKLKNQNEQFRTKLYAMETSLCDKQEDINAKEEKLFEYSGLLYNLQQKLQLRTQQNRQSVSYLNNEWTNKYDSMCEQYEQRLQLVQKDRDYFKAIFEEKEREVSKMGSQIKSLEAADVNSRKTFEEKFRKLEDDRMSALSQKNTELQRALEEGRSYAESLKGRETELRRLGNELEVARKTIGNLDQKSKDYDEKIKGVNRVYQTQLEQMKKRDVAFKAYKESVANYQWNVQREVKKGIQNFIKNFLQITEDKNSQKIVDLARSLEKSFVEALATKPQDK